MKGANPGSACCALSIPCVSGVKPAEVSPRLLRIAAALLRPRPLRKRGLLRGLPLRLPEQRGLPLLCTPRFGG